MGFDINWNLAQPVNAGEMFAAGLERGQAKRAEQDQRNALTAYVQKPGKESLNALAPYNPQFVMQERQRMQAAEQQQQQAMVRSQAVQGDPNAQSQLAGFDPDLWMKLDTHTKEKAKQSTAMLGSALWQIGQLPEEQKPAAWAHYVQQFEASGTDIPQQYEQYSPDAFNALLAETSQTAAYIKQNEPQWTFSPNGGLINKNDPASIEAYQQWMAGGGGGSPGAPQPQAPMQAPRQIKGADDYNALPPGTPYIDPNGVHRTKGGAAPSGAQTFP